MYWLIFGWVHIKKEKEWIKITFRPALQSSVVWMFLFSQTAEIPRFDVEYLFFFGLFVCTNQQGPIKPDLKSNDAAVLKQYCASFLPSFRPSFFSSRHPSFLASFLPSTLANPLFSLSVGPRADSTQTQLACLGLGELCVWPLLGPIMVAGSFSKLEPLINPVGW